MIKNYLKIARFDHWFKNVFMIPGILLGVFYCYDTLEVSVLLTIAVGLLSTCFIASSNYVINEWLDAEFDKFHPVKKNRPAVTAGLKLKFVLLEYFIFLSAGLLLAYLISYEYLFISMFFAFMGVMYNVKPVRTKDVVYLDTLSESVNNPIRLVLGWYLVSNIVFPSSSLILSYWMAGAFLMAIKRFAEYRFIDNPKTAMLYRKSFKHYDENKLLISAFFYALSTTFFLGIFLIKHRSEFLISVPFISILFAWYLKIGLKPDSPVQNPEKLYKEKKFILYIVFLAALVISLFFIDIPCLEFLSK